MKLSNNYISNFKAYLNTKVEQQSTTGTSISVERLEGNVVYLKNNGNYKVKLNKVTVADGSNSCGNFDGLTLNVGVYGIPITNCNIKSGNDYEVVTLTDAGVFQEKEIAKGTSSNNNPNNNSSFEPVNETQDSTSIVLGDLESTFIVLNGVFYNISINSISQQSAKIVVNGKSIEIQIDSIVKVAGIYISINDLFYSETTLGKSYIKLKISNKEIGNDNFFCSDSGSNVIGYLGGVNDNISSVSDSCFDNNTKLDYFCANNDKTISKQYINCPYGCSTGECRICSVKEENKLSNTFNLGEGDVFNLNTSNGPYPIEVLSVASDKVLLKVGSETKSYYSCETFESNGIKFQSNDLIQSLGDGVKSYVEFGYDYINSGSSNSSGQETNFELTDSFNFWKDQYSHYYSTFGDVSSGAYVCFDNRSFASNPNYIGNPDPEYNTLRLGNCDLTNESSVSVVLDVLKNSSKIQLKIKEATGYNQFDLYLDNIYYGHFNTVSRCQYTFLNFNNLMNLTNDGKIKVTIVDGAPGSCLGDMQISDLKIYSSY